MIDKKSKYLQFICYGEKWTYFQQGQTEINLNYSEFGLWFGFETQVITFRVELFIVSYAYLSGK